MTKIKTTTTRKSKVANPRRNPNSKPPKQERPIVHAPASLVHQVCGLTDPFCEHARGAKYPDDSSTRTLPFTIQQQQIITTDGNGAWGFTVMPQIGLGYITYATAVTGSIVTNDPLVYATIPPLTGATSYRIVSAGLRLRNIAPTLTSSGMVYVRSWASGTGGDYSTIDGASFSASKCADYALSDVHDVCVTFEHTNQPPANFYPLNNNNLLVDWQQSGFNPITVTVVGGPAAIATLSMELLMHIEYAFDDTSALGLAATPSPPANSLVTHAASKITSTAKTFVAHGIDTVVNFVDHPAKNIIGNMLLSYGPTRPLGMIMNSVDMD